MLTRSDTLRLQGGPVLCIPQPLPPPCATVRVPLADEFVEWAQTSSPGRRAVKSQRTLRVYREDLAFLMSSFSRFLQQDPSQRASSSETLSILIMVEPKQRLESFLSFLWDVVTPASGTSRRYNLLALLAKVAQFHHHYMGVRPASCAMLQSLKRDAAAARTKSYRAMLKVPAQQRSDFISATELRTAGHFLRSQMLESCRLPMSRSSALELHRTVLTSLCVLVVTQRSQVYANLKTADVFEGLQGMRLRVFSSKTGSQCFLTVPFDVANALRHWLAYGRPALLKDKRHDFVFLRVASGAQLLKPYPTVRAVMFRAIGRDLGPAAIRRSLATVLAHRAALRREPTTAEVTMPLAFTHPGDEKTTVTIQANPVELNSSLASLSGHSARTRAVVYTSADQTSAKANALATSAMEDLFGSPTQANKQRGANVTPASPAASPEALDSQPHRSYPQLTGADQYRGNKRRKWSQAELDDLTNAVQQFGPHFSDILRLPYYRAAFPKRRAVDLAAKYRALQSQ